MKWLLALVLALVLFATPAAAEDPPLPNQPRPDQFVGLDPFNPASRMLREEGVFPYRLEYTQGCIGDVWPALFSAMQNIHDETGVVFVERDDGWVIRANCGPSFAAVCGSSTGIIGCLGRGFPVAVHIDLNTLMAYPVAYSQITQISIMLHELMHALLTWNEQYAGISGQIVCVGGWQDFMNCGPDSRHLFSYIERERWKRTAGPSQVTGWGRGNNGAPYIFWCGAEGLATRVALMAYNTWTGQWRWTGNYAPTGNGGCIGWHFYNWGELYPNEIPCINVESAATIWLGRNDICP